MSDAIVSQYLKTMPRKFECCGSGGSFTGEVRYAHPVITIREKVNIDEARNILITESKKLMSLFNANKQIRPYLHDFPVTYKNICFSFGFEDKQGKEHVDGSVVHAFVTNKGVFYSKCNPETQQLELILTESWDEAEKKYEAYALTQKAHAKSVTNIATKNGKLRGQK